MSRRFALVAVALVGFLPGFVTTANAQERPDFVSRDMTSAFLNTSATPAIRLANTDPEPVEPFRAPRRGPSPLLGSLYLSTAAMQALDMHSTLQAFRAGAVEGNPLMSGITKNRGVFMATKAAVAASTILAARQIAKRNKVAAVVTMVAINSAYAMIVSHNYKLARVR
jgi:hypothetical protein